LLLRALELFSNTTGLEANQRKIEIYYCGSPNKEVEDLIKASVGSNSQLSPYDIPSLLVLNISASNSSYEEIEFYLQVLSVAWMCKYLQTRVCNMGNYLFSKESMWFKVWLITNKRDNLLVKWTHSVYLKNRSWREYQPPTIASWLAIHGKLQTRCRLQKIGITDVATCLLCGERDETHNHIFHECYYSSRRIQEILK
ncbi:Fibroblast growth factor 23, partial [Bienertia sinuspersici]